jgi:hypothetical protein
MRFMRAEEHGLPEDNIIVRGTVELPGAFANRG